MFNKIIIAALFAASFCAKAQTQTIEFTNTTGDQKEYIFDGRGFADAKDDESKGTPFLLISKQPNQTDRALMSELCYDFNPLPLPVGLMAVVTITEKTTGQETWEYWRPFDKGTHSLCMTTTRAVAIKIVFDPKNPKKFADK